MVPGSDEEQWMMAATSLAVPFTSAILSERWILIDRTCQIMFVGDAATSELVFVFPTSTGEPGYETRDQDRSAGRSGSIPRSTTAGGTTARCTRWPRTTR